MRDLTRARLECNITNTRDDGRGPPLSSLPSFLFPTRREKVRRRYGVRLLLLLIFFLFLSPFFFELNPRHFFFFSITEVLSMDMFFKTFKFPEDVQIP